MSSTSSTPEEVKREETAELSVVWLTAQESDLNLLRSGKYSDFTIQCGERKWRTHKSILRRCLYFENVFSSNWKETLESKIVIEGNFEPFEINALIQALYSSEFNLTDLDDLREALPSKSYLEACVRLWILGDFFIFTSLITSASRLLQIRCRQLQSMSAHVSFAWAGLNFLPDLEAAVQLAWAPDTVDGEFREPLLDLCAAIHPYLYKHPSFSDLLENSPSFAVRLLQRMLGLDAGSLNAKRQTCGETFFCGNCKNEITISTKTVPRELEGVIFHAGTSLRLVGAGPYDGIFYCGRCAKGRLSKIRKHDSDFHLQDCEQCLRKKRP